MKRPNIKRGPASAYAAPNECIRELSTEHGGGLIKLTLTEQGHVHVSLYRLDAGVRVHVSWDGENGEQRTREVTL